MVERIEDEGDDAELHEAYSGRGMMGATTHGICVESLDVFYRGCIELAHDLGAGFIKDESGEIHRELTGSFRTDRLGHDTIVY